MEDEQRRESTRGKRRRKVRRRRRNIPKPIFVVSIVVVVCALVGLAFAITRVAKPKDGAASGAAGQAMRETSVAEQRKNAVTFCAMGDNLMNTAGDYTVDLLGLADAWSGTTDDGKYDFSPLYAQLKNKIASCDIAFVNQETTLGGTAEYEYQGYPAYNTPDEVAKAISDAGFDVVNCGTNHTYDTWVDSIVHSLGVWASYPDISVVGSYASQKERDRIRVVERDGMKIAFLAYCYGTNGYDQSDLPNDYYVAPFDKSVMSKEIAEAKKLADAVVVYMHWGNENDHELSTQQLEYASFLAEQGVDLTIGSHAHVIQPVQYVPREGSVATSGARASEGSSSSSSSSSSTSSVSSTSADGSVSANAKDGMLCVYGLGDFVSGYTLPKTILSGMFTCDFVRDEKGNVVVENPVWHGLVEHNEGNTDTVCLLSEYTDEQARNNTLLARVGEDDTYTTSDPLEWCKQTTREVIGNVIPVGV